MANELRYIDLEDGKPAVADALKRMRQELRQSQKWSCSAVKLIHGFGSTGRGGKIRTAVRRELAEMQSRGEISIVIPGEKLTIFEEETRTLMNRCPELRRDSDMERHNNGITVVGLKKKGR